MKSSIVALGVAIPFALACGRPPAGGPTPAAAGPSLGSSPVVGALPARPIEIVVEPDGGVVLDPEAAKSVLRPCSRDFPTGLSGYWQPSPQDIAALETRLPESLAQHLPPNDLSTRVRQIRVYRQYVGMYRAGIPIVYVNGLPGSFVERHPDRWPTGAFQVCGGGSEFFGIVFTPATGRFDNFAANGPI